MSHAAIPRPDPPPELLAEPPPAVDAFVLAPPRVPQVPRPLRRGKCGPQAASGAGPKAAAAGGRRGPVRRGEVKADPGRATRVGGWNHAAGVVRQPSIASSVQGRGLPWSCRRLESRAAISPAVSPL